MAGQKTPSALGTESIGKLLMQYAVPAIIAMTASSLYNMVDSIFIGHGVGTMAISGLALTFPLMNLAAAFGSLVGVGASTLISVKLGQRDYDTAQRVLGNVFVLNMVLGVALTIIVMLFLDPILYFFGGSDQTVGYARDYMQIILLGNAVTHLYLGLNAVLRSSGHPQKAMYATIATVVINTILDPVFIYGFGWGIRGAAVATIVAQVISLAWQFKLFSNKDELLHFHRGIFRLKRKIVFDSLAIGMSPFLMNLAACFIVIIINQGLKKYGGDLAIGAFGIVNRLVFIVVMIVMGLNQGMQPIAGYNFGAKLYGRVNKVLRLTIIYATVVTTFGFLVGMLVPDLVVGIGCGTDRAFGHGTAYYGNVLPDYWFPDGDFQLFPEHRHGRQSDIPFPHPADADPASLPACPAAVFRSGRSVVQHAGIRFACKFDSIGDVGLSIPQIQNLSLVGMGRGRGFEFFFLLSADIP